MLVKESTMPEKNKKKKIVSNSYVSKSINDTEKIAKNIAKNAKAKDIYCLIGDLGTGKTVIAKAIGSFFNVDDSISSPTFTILKSYDLKNKIIKRIHHFDLYRIKNIQELNNIGFEDYLYDENAIILIEWPDIAKDLLPKHYKTITIKKSLNDNSEYLENERQIIYEEK